MKIKKNKSKNACKTYRELHDKSYESLAGIIMKLKEERTKKNISIDEMAERLNEDGSTINRLEDGSDIPVGLIIDYALELGYELKFSIKQ